MYAAWTLRVFCVLLVDDGDAQTPGPLSTEWVAHREGVADPLAFLVSPPQRFLFFSFLCVCVKNGVWRSPTDQPLLSMLHPRLKSERICVGTGKGGMCTHDCSTYVHP